MDYTKRIHSLEKKYSSTNVAKDEALSSETIYQINHTYNKNQQKRRVDAILNNVKNKDSIKEEVHNIVKNVKLKTLCWNCKEEQIIAIIILYVQRTRNNQFRVNRSKLWNDYNITWKKYSLIIERLLQWSRERQRVEIKEVERFDDDYIMR